MREERAAVCRVSQDAPVPESRQALALRPHGQTSSEISPVYSPVSRSIKKHSIRSSRQVIAKPVQWICAMYMCNVYLQCIFNVCATYVQSMCYWYSFSNHRRYSYQQRSYNRNHLSRIRLSLQLALTQLESIAQILNERKRESDLRMAVKCIADSLTGNSRLTKSLPLKDRCLVRVDNVRQLDYQVQSQTGKIYFIMVMCRSCTCLFLDQFSSISPPPLSPRCTTFRDDEDCEDETSTSRINERFAHVGRSRTQRTR